MDKFPKKNLTTKILAVVLATVLWIYVMNEQNPPIEVAFPVTLEVRNLADNLTVNNLPDSVRIKVRGSRSVIAALSQSDIKAYADLKGLTEGVHTVKIHADLPGSLDVVETTPDRVSANLEAIVTKQASVEIWTSGAPPQGVTVAAASSSTPYVQVEGPRSQINSLYKIVAQVDLANRTGNFTAEALLMGIDQEGRAIEGLHIHPGKVNVTISLSETSSKKTVGVKPLLINEAPKNVTTKRIVTEPEQVEIYGTAQELEKIEFVYTAPINLADVDKDIKMDSKLQLKDGVTAKNNTVTVHISAEKK